MLLWSEYNYRHALKLSSPLARKPLMQNLYSQEHFLRTFALHRGGCIIL